MKTQFNIKCTYGDPPHGVGAVGFLRLQNPRLTVNLIQDIPEVSQGLQEQQELTVELLQSALDEKKIRKSRFIFKRNQMYPKASVRLLVLYRYRTKPCSE